MQSFIWNSKLNDTTFWPSLHLCSHPTQHLTIGSLLCVPNLAWQGSALASGAEATSGSFYMDPQLHWLHHALAATATALAPPPRVTNQLVPGYEGPGRVPVVYLMGEGGWGEWGN